MTPTTLSKNPSKTVSDADIRVFLDGVIGDDRRHARLLNTFSLMEHIGSRKILLSQGEKSGEDVLKHLAEETRHAHFFRRAAEKTAKRKLSYADADMAAAPASRMYFGRLDAGISRRTGPGVLAYLYVTQAIEVRAGSLYHLYESILRAASHSLSLRGVIAEEDLHLAHMETALRGLDPQYAERTAQFVELEAGLFAAWFKAVSRALA